MKKAMKKVLCAATAGILAASMVSCGSSDSSSNATVEKDGKTLTTLNFQLKWLPSVQFMGFYEAYEKGYYEDEGIDLNIISGGSDIVSAQQVSIGAADIGISNLYGLLPYEEQGYPITQIGQVFQQESIVLVSKAEKGIATPEDLKGKKIGAWVGTADYPIYSLLEKFGMNKDTDCTIVNQDYTMDALLNDDIDVASATIYNEYIVLQESGIDESDINVINFNDFDCGMLEDALIVNTDWAANEGSEELINGFMKASMKGWADACADPAGAAKTVWNYVDQSSTTLEHQTKSAEQVAKIAAPDGTEPSKMLALDDATIQSTIDSCIKYSIISKAPEKAYDDTYLNAAKKALG